MTLALPTLDDFRMAVDAWVQTPGRGPKAAAYVGHDDYAALLKQANLNDGCLTTDKAALEGRRWKLMGVPLYKVDASRHFHITDHP
jgi:hypothetical protein